MRIGVDVGGTFTDVVMVDDETGTFHYAKTPTTHHDLAEGVLTGLRDILEMAGVTMGQVDYIIHGTTIGTNAIVEGRGAKVGLITTAGFEDVLEIRRVARPKEAAFDFGADNPPPLVPRYLRKGARERINSKGEVAVSLDEESVRQAASFFREQAVEAVVVSLLFSFLNPDHEERVAAICRDLMPAVPVSLSSEICPEFREYERTCTTVMNGYLGPVIQSYMDHLTARLRAKYGQVTLHIMQSNGGTMTAEVAKKKASHLINSGPAGGAIAAAFVSRLTNNQMAIGADMGGTTFDISIIDRNLPKTTTWGGITNYPIKLPMVDLKTIGAGGGSIAWVDGGALNVGPQSAGSDPGPACYGWGGELPTVSDANLLLGRLNPEYFLGGKLPLYPEKARKAIKVYVANPMGISEEEAAVGIIRIVNANMAKGISGNSMERGYDLREFALISMGGAAGLHAADIAGELNMGRVIIPPMSGNLSAVGMVVADIQHDYVKTFAKKDHEIDPDELLMRFKEMEAEGMDQLMSEKVSKGAIEITWSADLRYEGQSWELNAPIKRAQELSQEDIHKIVNDFHSLHQQIYSYSEPGEVVEFINLRVRVKGKNPPLSMQKRKGSQLLIKEGWKTKRDVYFEGIGWQSVPVYEREDLDVGSRVPGPCIVEETISTALIPPGSIGLIDEFGNIMITLDHGGISEQAIRTGGDVKYKADAVTMQVIRYGLEAVADDMGHNLMRMGRTTIVKEIMDINCAVLDAQGGILAQAHLCPLMMFSLPTTAAYMLKRIDRFEEGDVIICNDPYLGGQHLLDVQFFSPVMVEGERIAFVANIAHQLDMGGAVPGGVAGGLTEIYQEGLRIPFVKLYCQGEEDPQIFDIISSNIRIPEKTMEDFRAQAATTMVGVKRVKELVTKYGLDVFHQCARMLTDYSENKVRRFIASLPDGKYTGVDYLDDDGQVDEPIKVQVNVHISGDGMKVDFQGSGPQTKGNVNCPWACSQGGVFYTMVGIVDPHMPLNAGTFRPIEVEGRKGLVTDPLPPAGVTARSQTMTKIVEAMLRAMSEVVPERVVAGSHGQACTSSFSGIHPETGKRFGYIEILGGGAGARPDKDGPDGQDLHLGRFMNTPVEAAEIENPVMIERYEFIPDSGGAGKYRGGLSLRRDIRFLTDVTWARYSDRQKFKPLGLFGGREGTTGALILNPGTPGEKRCRSKGVDQLKAGDVLSIRLPGSGGYGPPEERPPEQVRWDVINGKVSLESAEKQYGIVFDGEMYVDMEGTRILRSQASERARAPQE